MEESPKSYIASPKIKDEDISNFIRRNKKVMEGLVEGRIVHFVLDNHVFKTNPDEVGKSQSIEGLTCRPAIIVNAWGGKLEDGMVNLIVLFDGSNDVIAANRLEIMWIGYTAWITSVKYSETKEIGTWHWPERN
jgi:hypothetical protein